jgi:hypothetical protein
VVSACDKHISIQGNIIYDCIDGVIIRSSYGEVIIKDNSIIGTHLQPLYFVNTATKIIEGNVIKGGSKAISIRVESGTFSSFCNNIIKGINDNYSISILIGDNGRLINSENQFQGNSKKNEPFIVKSKGI